jgi:SAM-dependent MidA family methyltransferase
MTKIVQPPANTLVEGISSEELKSVAVEFVASGPDGVRTFRDYMGFCLYGEGYNGPRDPTEIGYYTSGRARIGSGDFNTAPELSPLFGIRVAHLITNRWEQMGKPAGFQIIEQGAGNGTLAHHVMQELHHSSPDLAEEAAYVIVEKSPVLKRNQQALLDGSRVEWKDEEEVSDVTGVHISNELLDVFPVHYLRIGPDGITELQVGTDGQNLVETWGNPSRPLEFAAYFDLSGDNLMPGDRIVNLQMLEWLAATASKLKDGSIITVDYAPQPDQKIGLVAHYGPEGNKPGARYEKPGELDITTQVDFAILKKFAERLEFERVEVETFRNLFGRLQNNPSDIARERDWIMRSSRLRCQMHSQHIGDYEWEFIGHKALILQKSSNQAQDG